MPSRRLLKISGLTVDYSNSGRAVRAVNRLSLSVRVGEFVGLIGESGSGKSTVAKAVLGILPVESRIDGSIIFDNQSIGLKSEDDMKKLRGAQIGFVPQQPVAALNPVRTIGSQLSEIFHLCVGTRKSGAWKMSAELLERVHMKDIERVMRAYPHELSGGMCQRVVLAMSIAQKPSLLLADEPTTSVDAYLRLELLNEIRTQQKERNMAVLFVSHDLNLVGRYADRLAVMYGGDIVETAAPDKLFSHPRHPYTRLLLGKETETDVFLEDSSLLGGCSFSPRCREATPICFREKPGWNGDEITGWACFRGDTDDLAGEKCQ